MRTSRTHHRPTARIAQAPVLVTVASAVTIVEKSAAGKTRGPPPARKGARLCTVADIAVHSAPVSDAGDPDDWRTLIDAGTRGASHINRSAIAESVDPQGRLSECDRPRRGPRSARSRTAARSRLRTGSTRHNVSCVPPAPFHERSAAGGEQPALPTSSTSPSMRSMRIVTSAPTPTRVDSSAGSPSKSMNSRSC